MASVINVKPLLVNDKGYNEYFGDETGTPEFYMVLDILYKHLGKENILVSWDYKEFFYKIEVIENKYSGYIKILESIKEPVSIHYRYADTEEEHKNDCLTFQVIYN